MVERDSGPLVALVGATPIPVVSFFPRAFGHKGTVCAQTPSMSDVRICATRCGVEKEVGRGCRVLSDRAADSDARRSVPALEILGDGLRHEYPELNTEHEREKQHPVSARLPAAVQLTRHRARTLHGRATEVW